ncbi:MAG: PilZ domain-containing protein [Desulfobulbaceae bacterium]|uniref:PilZ domain-containing protein n=1 Tax=Candidatus Desulfobia pelagia TaxID=2841692 RepID=A0A8J6NFF2_9BACT|nr:PilZ domain-containing protein [Candidatus Desulfobia pelagia]
MGKSGKKNTTQSDTQVVRQFFRMPINNCSNISFQIDNNPFEIVNIGNSGIAFYTGESSTKLEAGKGLHPVELRLHDTSISLQGQIMHISANGDQEICGMKFIDMENDRQEILEKYLNDTLASVFNK